MPVVIPSHITVDDRGVARIDDTRLKVIHLVAAWKSGAATPEGLQAAYPQLSLAQVHAALSYYYDNQAAIDAEIERDLREFDAARSTAEETPGRQKLRDLGLRP